MFVQFDEYFMLDFWYALCYNKDTKGKGNIKMKFYSVKNPDYRAVSALSLINVRRVSIEEESSTRASRFSVCLEYTDGIVRSFNYLTADFANTIYLDIIDILNGEESL